MAVNKLPTIGILGAGKLGVTLAQLALKAGYTVYIAGSGAPAKINLAVEVLAPGAIATTSQAAAQAADIVVLALPLSKYRQLPQQSLAGKLVIDAMNYWWETDGYRSDFIEHGKQSSVAVQEFLESFRVVKALNHIGYHDLHDAPRPKGSPGRKAVAIAGDNQLDVAAVSRFVNDLGFEPMAIGSLQTGYKLEPGGKVFGKSVEPHQLLHLLADEN